MTKPTATEKANRVEQTKMLLLTGATRAQIVQNLTKKFGVIDRTIDNYLAEAREQLQVDLETIRPYALAEHIAHRRELRLRLRQEKDYTNELRAAQDEAKLLGLYEDRVRQIGWQDEVIDAIRRGELEPEIAKALYGEQLALEFFRKAGVDAG